MVGALRPGLLRQDGVCLARVHDLHQHVQRATVHAEGDCECRGLLGVALQLSMLHAAAAPSNLKHREDPAGGLVDVHDSICADSVLVHQPAQLDEQPVPVGLLQSRAVELFHALGGLLEAQAHATHELSDPPLAGTDVESSASSHSCTKPLIVTALKHKTSVTSMMCSLSRVMSADDSKVLLPSVSARGAPFPAVGSVRVDPVEHPGAQTLDLAQAPLHVPSPLSPPLVQHVEEPVAGDRVDVDLAALGSAAAGIVFNECGGCTGSLGVGELLVCERPVVGFSWLPPGRPHADAVWELVVLEDVVLQGSFPELLPAGASGEPPPHDWKPTQTNRQGDGGPLGPHVVE